MCEGWFCGFFSEQISMHMFYTHLKNQENLKKNQTKQTKKKTNKGATIKFSRKPNKGENTYAISTWNAAEIPQRSPE